MAAPPDALAPAPALLTLPLWRQRAAVFTFCAFVVGWSVVGVRGLVADDSRFAWGMFPYVLEVKVEVIRFVDERGGTRPWKPKRQRHRVPRVVRPGVTDETYGYGKGAYDALVRGILAVAAKDAAKDDVAVEAVVVTRRSERPPQTETVRQALR